MASFISTHSLTRRLTEHPIEYIQAMLFQLTASQGGWRIGSNERKYQWYFNSQPHKEADVVARTVLFAYRKFQLTASQGGWPWTPPTVTSRRTISTHSLTRRLTRTAERYHRSGCISTHSLTRRLTPAGRPPSGSLRHFNSQPHKEADYAAPLLSSLHGYFNSQPHKEADCTSSS